MTISAYRSARTYVAMQPLMQVYAEEPLELWGTWMKHRTRSVNAVIQILAQKSCHMSGRCQLQLPAAHSPGSTPRTHEQIKPNGCRRHGGHMSATAGAPKPPSPSQPGPPAKQLARCLRLDVCPTAPLTLQKESPVNATAPTEKLFSGV